MDAKRMLAHLRTGFTATLFAISPVSAARAATVVREIHINAPPAAVWDAVRDIGAVDRRLAPGLIVSDHVENGIRTLTFANGRVMHEEIISIDDPSRRLAWTTVGGAATHHNASMQVFEAGTGARLLWIADILPDSLAGPTSANLDTILAVIKTTLERKP